MANENEQIPFTLEAYAALKAAYGQGAARVKYDGKEIDFRTLNDMERIMRNMEKELFPSRKKTTDRKYLSFTKGFK